LSVVATAPNDDPAHAQQLAAARLLNRLWETHPTHPGVVHYLIHAYDHPDLAPLGLKAARAYAAIAPSVPHAQHMPSHIFTQLGLWGEAMASDQNSARSARAGRTGPDSPNENEAHSLSFLEYDYLQVGDDDRARDVVERMRTIPRIAPTAPARHASATVPARYVIERHDWAAGREFAEPAQMEGAWKLVSAVVRAYSFARGGDAAGAEKEAAAIADALASLPSSPLKRQLEQQLIEIHAWILHLRGRDADAVAQLGAAAEQEQIAPGDPPALIPLGECLGDLLLDMKRPADALAAYMTSNATRPNRLNTLSGEFRAADALHNTELARTFARQIAALVRGSGSTRPDIAAALAYLASDR
jgi:hypothetical protein